MGEEEKESEERKREGEEKEDRKKTGRKGREGGWGVNSQVSAPIYNHYARLDH